MPIGQLGMLAASTGSGMLMGEWNDRRQRRQQEDLQNIQLRGNEIALKQQARKELEMWKATSYPAQIKMMKEAGINPALMYGMGGGGGTTVGGGGAGVSGGTAPSGGGEMMGVMGIGLQAKAQTELLKAQKENIEAQTANLGAETKYTGGAKTENTNQDTNLKLGQTWETNLRAALTEYMQMADENGNRNVGMEGSMAVKEKKLELVMKSETIRKVGQDITLMKAKGLTEGQVYENLKKDGQLKDTEIEWNALDLQGDNAGKFLTNLIKWIFKR